MGPVPGGPFLSDRAGRGARAARGLVRAARPALAGRDRPGRGRHRGRGARDGDRGARRPRPRPGRRRAGRHARPRPARHPGGGPRPGRALPALARGRPRPGPGGGRDAVRDVRPGRPASAWSCSGTTATTCWPSRARRTRTPARCWRCGRTGPRAAALLGGFARTAEVTQLVAGGWAIALTADRADGPAVGAAGHRGRRRRGAGQGRGRPLGPAAQPGAAHRARGARPRAGAVPGAPARLPRRGGLRALRRAGPLPGVRRPAVPARGAGGGRVRLVRRGRGRAVPAAAGSPALRALVVGAGAHRGGAGPGVPGRAGADLRAAPGHRRGGRRARRSSSRRRAPSRAPTDGYAAAVLLDGWALLGRASLRAAEEALRRWLNAAALVRPGAPRAAPWWSWPTRRCPPVQALVRWDPVTLRRARTGRAQRAPVPPGGPDGRADRAAGRRPEVLARADLPAGARGARAGAGGWRRRRGTPARRGGTARPRA